MKKRKRTRLEEAYRNKRFPFSSQGTPPHFICHDCGGNGWGPMLTTETWESITDTNGEGGYYFLLCEGCMSERKGSPLESKDLRDCPMNYLHPLYEKHGRM